LALAPVRLAPFVAAHPSEDNPGTGTRAAMSRYGKFGRTTNNEPTYSFHSPDCVFVGEGFELHSFARTLRCGLVDSFLS
jgi:hypothetical protein